MISVHNTLWFTANGIASHAFHCLFGIVNIDQLIYFYNCIYPNILYRLMLHIYFAFVDLEKTFDGVSR